MEAEEKGFNFYMDDVFEEIGEQLQAPTLSHKKSMVEVLKELQQENDDEDGSQVKEESFIIIEEGNETVSKNGSRPQSQNIVGEQVQPSKCELTP